MYTVNFLKYPTLFSFQFSNNVRAGFHKMLVGIVIRGKHDQKQSHLGLHCLSKTF